MLFALALISCSSEKENEDDAPKGLLFDSLPLTLKVSASRPYEVEGNILRLEALAQRINSRTTGSQSLECKIEEGQPEKIEFKQAGDKVLSHTLIEGRTLDWIVLTKLAGSTDKGFTFAGRYQEPPVTIDLGEYKVTAKATQTYEKNLNTVEVECLFEKN